MSASFNIPRFAACYIRVSTDEQVDLSPESQLTEIRKYADREGYVLLEDHIYVDEGISGRKADHRPAFQNMIAAAKSPDHSFDAILLWKFSRFARNQEESIFYKSILRSKCHVDVISISEPLIAGPFGSLIERIIEWMDEFYSIRLSQEVKRSMTLNAQRGKLQCSASFGYRSSDGTLVPHEEEAPLVRRMYADFLDGKPIFAIVKEMNAMGVRTHRGNPFENRTVEYILRNPVYIGKLRWNPSGRTRRDWGNEHIILSPGNHAPLIDAATWNAAQRRLDEVKLQWGYKAKPSYNLKGWTSGIVRCASCGKTLVFSAPHYWKCNGYVHGSCQFSQHVRAGILEQAIIDRLKDDCASASPLTFTVSCSGPSGGAELNRQEVILRQLRSKLSRLQDAYLSGVIDLACFAASKNDLDAAARQAEEKIAQIRSQCDPDSVNEKLRKNISHALQTLQSPDASIEEKNASARSIIESCTFSRNDRLLSITYRFIF